MKNQKLVLTLCSFLLLVSLRPVWAGDDDTCHEGGGGGSVISASYFSSLNEGCSSGYRKIRLDGKLQRDTTPLEKSLKDSEDENTFVDAFSQTLVHQVTDIYIPFEGSEVALALRRNTTPETWSTYGSVPPASRPDRPFGPCWTSGPGASVELIMPVVMTTGGLVRDPTKAMYVSVTDEDGASYRFVVASYGESETGFLYLPSSGSEKQAGDVVLTGDLSSYTLTKKHGTAVSYSGGATVYTYNNLGRASEKHIFSQITGVMLPSGEIIDYSLGGITFRGRTITLSGYPVGEATDPEGNTTYFDYADGKLVAVTKPDGSVVQYGYSSSSEIDDTPREPTDLSPANTFYTQEICAITDGRNNMYQIFYVPDHTKYNYMGTIFYTGPYLCRGNPRLVSGVYLPDDGYATFGHVGTMVLDSISEPTDSISGSHGLAVMDAEGHYWGVGFTGASVVRRLDYVPRVFQNPPTTFSVPYYVTFSGMNITTEAGDASLVSDEDGRLKEYNDISFSNPFTFDYGDSGDVTEIHDPEDRVTKFTYGENHRIHTILDAENRLTDRTLGANGRTDKEVIKDPSGNVLQETDYSYGIFFPTIPIQKVVKKSSSDPSWAVDLITNYELDSQGNILKEKVGSPGNERVTEYTYDNNNNKTSVTDPNGNVTTFTYDGCNRVTEIDPPGPGSKKMYYDENGNKIREEDENGNATLWEYNTRNRVVKEARDMNGNHEIDSADLVTQTTYDKLAAKTSVTTPNGDTTTFEYDDIGRLVKTTDPLDQETTLTYGANSGGLQFGEGYKPTKTVDPRGFETLVTYNTLFDPTETKVQYATSGTTPVYAVTKLEYDAVGNLTKATDPLNHETTKQYDALNREIVTTFPDSTEVQTFYTLTGLKWKTIDEMSYDTLTEYDDAGRPVKVSSPVVDIGATGTTGRAVTQTTYDDAGNAIATTNPLGYVWSSTFDSRNRKIAEVRPGTGSPTVRTEYDAVGNVTKVTDARGAETETEYDEANRVVKVTAPAVAVMGSGTVHPVTETEYDKNGNVTSLTDANGHETTNTYDELNRLLTTTDAEGIVVTNEYDEVGNRTAVVDGESHRTEFTYDGLNRNLTITDALSKTTTFEYDGLNKTARVDAAGIRTEYAYDTRNRLTQASYKNALGTSVNDATNATRGYTYDLAGNLLAVTELAKSGKADVAYTYDGLRRILTETSGGLTHVYKYDLAGNRVYCLYGGLSVPLVSTYDEQNRLATLTQGASVTAYTYDLNGNTLTRVLPNGDATSSSYDALNRTTSLAAVNSGSNVLYSYAYQFDAVSNVRQVTENYSGTVLNRVVTNTYDDINRLTEEAVTGGGAGTTTFTYDDAHNRTSMVKSGTTTSYSYNDANQLTSYSDGTRAATLTYDDNGNRTNFQKLPPPPGANYKYLDCTYDYENRLVESKDGIFLSPAIRTTFTYDYRTRRVNRHSQKETKPLFGSLVISDVKDEKIAFSGGVSVREFSGTVATVDYVRGSDWGGGVGGILYTVRSGTASFTHYNRRGDVTAKTTASGSLTYQATYEAFGKRATEVGSTDDRQKSNSKDEDMPGYANEGFRFRDLETGVFLSKDPAGFVDGPNLYAYVVQNPWTNFDPEGLAKIRDYNNRILQRNRQIQQLDRLIRSDNISGKRKHQASLERNSLLRANGADLNARDKIEQSAQWINDQMQGAVDRGEMESFRAVKASELDDTSGLFAGIQEGMYAQSIMDFSHALMVGSQVTAGVATIGELATVGAAKLGWTALTRSLGVKTATRVADDVAIQFGKNSNQIEHAFRHVDDLGLDRTVVQSSIESHLKTVASQIVPGKPLNQIIEVGGQRIQYTAFKLEDGTINVGRIHGAP